MQLNLSKYPIPLTAAYLYSVKLNLHIPKTLLNPNYIFHLLLNHGSPAGLICLKIKIFSRKIVPVVDVYVKSVFQGRISFENIADLIARKYKCSYVIVNSIKFKFSNIQTLSCNDKLYPVNDTVCIAISDHDNNVLVGFKCYDLRWSLICRPVINDKLKTVLKSLVTEYCTAYDSVQKLRTITLRQKSIYIYKVRISDWKYVNVLDLSKYRLYNIVNINHLKFLSPAALNIRSL